MSKEITSVEKEKLYNSFLSRFPLDSLQNMTLEQYTGTGDSRDAFCYWVQYKVDKVGGMRGGSSDIFGIYKYINPSKKPKMISDSQYSWLKELGSDANAAWEKIKGLICSIAKSANEEKYGDIDSIQCIGNNFKWKVAFLYSNKKIPPIYSEKAVKYLAKKHNINIANSEPQSNIETKLMSLKGDMDFWEFADMLWDEYKKSDDWFLKTIASIAESLKEKMESEKFSYVSNNYDIFARNKKHFFIWVKTGDGIIGTENCHYEFYFDKNNKKGNKLFPMIHFESDFEKDKTVLKRLSDVCDNKKLKGLPYYKDHWFYIGGSEMDIGDYEDDPDLFCDTAIKWMRELDNRVGDEIKREINRMSSKDNLEPYVNKLKKVKNLILTGAPGTGKTYMAKDIAAMIVSGDKTYEDIEKDNKLKEQIGFVQFHPSYDYTDFIEGLRPVSDNDDGNQIAFERTDGIFKEFCKKAVKALSSKGRVDNFEESLAEMIKSANDDDFFDIPYLSGKGKSGEDTFKIVLNTRENGFVRMKPNGERSNVFVNFKQLYNVYIGLPGTPKGGYDPYRRAIINYLKKNFGLKDFKPGDKDSTDTRKYVFIIDEINRGEVSKIFGELFYCIEPGYRGEKGRIKTQYQNLVDIGDEFKEGFYVPENVYIIGTMNDIDRSVESMDFAFRRRFAWVEIKASDRQEMLKELPANIAKDAKLRMDSLNNAIWKKDADDNEKIEGMSSAYHIGASYFLNLKNYIDIGEDPFEALWEYHLEPLLREYLRGIDDSDSIIDRLHKSYKNPVASNDSQEDDSKSQT